MLHPSPQTGAVVDAATAFLATLSPAQRAQVGVELSAENAARWSNFPAGVVPRNGLFFRDLNAEQSAAALEVARTALSADGFTRMAEIRATDDVYAKSPAARSGPGAGGPPPGGNGGGPPDGFGGPPPGGLGRRGPGGAGNLFGHGNYIIALLGQPSKTAPWILQFGGHHLAVNQLYNGDGGTSTPHFVGIEPIRWTDDKGQLHDPLAPMRDSMLGLLASLTPEQKAAARLEARFHDVSVGPGRDGQFPAKSEGVLAAQLSEAAREFVRRAILAWTGDSVQAASYQALYLPELDATRVAFSGTGTLKSVGDYVRLDGPHLWIEFSCQPSRTEFPIHFHTVWRDKASDYGRLFAF